MYSQLTDITNQTKAALGASLCKAFLSNGYKSAVYVRTAEEAAAGALALIPDSCTVGIPGTVTVRQTGLMEKLAEKGCKVSHHWDPGLTPEETTKYRCDENNSDWFVTSSNAMTYDGKMVNIDGSGNRVAGMAWGQNSIIYIVSVGKAQPTLESAIARARNLATPPNAARLGGKVPCIETGRCMDCNAPGRFCRVLTIIERAPMGRDCHVILVGEDLGY